MTSHNETGGTCAGGVQDMSAACRETGPAAAAFPAAGPEHPSDASSDPVLANEFGICRAYNASAGPTVLVVSLDHAMLDALRDLGDFHCDDGADVPYDRAALHRFRDVLEAFAERTGLKPYDVQPSLRGPVQDESGALDPLDARAMAECEGRAPAGPPSRVLP